MLPTAVAIKQRMACEVGYYPEGLKAERKDERDNVCASSIFWPYGRCGFIFGGDARQVARNLLYQPPSVSIGFQRGGISVGTGAMISIFGVR